MSNSRLLKLKGNNGHEIAHLNSNHYSPVKTGLLQGNPMHEYLEKLSYTISAGLIAGDWLSLLDAHALAFGVILGFATFTTNLVFQYLNYRVRCIRIDADERL